MSQQAFTPFTRWICHLVFVCVLLLSPPVCDCADMVSPQGGAREPGRLDLNIVHSSQDRLRRRAQRSRVTSALNRTHRPFQIHQCSADSFFFYKPYHPPRELGISWEICNVLKTSAGLSQAYRGSSWISTQCELSLSEGIYNLQLTQRQRKQSVNQHINAIHTNTFKEAPCTVYMWFPESIQLDSPQSWSHNIIDIVCVCMSVYVCMCACACVFQCVDIALFTLFF